MILQMIRKRLIKGAQKAVAAALVTMGAVAVARYPILADVLTEENVEKVTAVLFDILLISGSGVASYVVTWWKRNTD